MKITTKLNKNYIYSYLEDVLYDLLDSGRILADFDEIHIFEDTYPDTDDKYIIEYIIRNKGKRLSSKEYNRNYNSFFDRKKLWDKEEHIYDYDDLMKNKILVIKYAIDKEEEINYLEIVDINDLNYKNMKNSKVWCVKILTKDLDYITEIDDTDNILIGDHAVESLEEYIKYYDIDTYYTLQLFYDTYIKLKNDKYGN
ncbi:hypothetical protein B7939_02040 [Eggerthia catenaformis]|nr:hypothetical protein B7939_02040 [Eggerthia catenaformis]